MRRLRLLFVAEYFWPRPTGGEIFSFELCRELTRRGHEVTVLTLRHEKDLAMEETVEGVHILRPYRTGKCYCRRIIAAHRLAKYARTYLATHEIDAIHVMAYAMNVPISRLARERNIPCVSSFTSYFGDDWRHLTPLWPILRYLERKRILRDASQAKHVPSAYVQQRILRETGVATSVIHHWIPDTFPRPAAAARGALLFVGSLEPVKNPLACVAVAQQLKLPLIVIGDGSLRRELERAAKRAKIACTIHPSLSREETLAHLGAAALVLIPSITESFSNVALEAVAQGTPVAGTPVGIIPELPGVVRFPPRAVPKRLSSAIIRTTQKNFAKNADAFLKFYTRR